MQLPGKISAPRELTPGTFALCLLMASSLQIIENLVPKIPIFPWLRFGLAYLVLLPFLIRFGPFNTLILFIFRNIFALIYGSQIFSSFLISSLSGTISILFTGWFAYHLYHRKFLGLLGISVLMSCSFNVIQLVVVNTIFIQHVNFFFQLTPLLTWSIISGSMLAFLIYRSEGSLNYLFVFRDKNFNRAGDLNSLSAASFQYFQPGAALLIITAIFLSSNIYIQLGGFTASLIITKFKKLKLLLYAWPFFFYLAWMHLFFTDGIFIYRDWITSEGLDNFLYLSLRTASIILAGQMFIPLIPKLQKKFAANKYIMGAGLALPILPALYGIAMSQGKIFFIQIKRKQYSDLLKPLIKRLEEELKI